MSVPTGALYTYPDVTVVCGEPAFEDAAADTLTNPTVIIEVLSPTTEAYDRGESGWLLHEASGLDGAVELAALGCAHALAEIYAMVSFAAGKAPI